MRLFMGLFLLASGCATALRGTHQRVTIQTDPPHATVQVDQKTYTAPVTLDLDRNAKQTVTVRKPGYQSIQFLLFAKLDAWSIPEFMLPGGEVLMTADITAGGAKKYNHLAVIQLKPTTAPTTRPTVYYEWNGELITAKQLQQIQSRMAAQRRLEMAQPPISR